MESSDLEIGHSNRARDCCSSFYRQEAEVAGVEDSDDDQMRKNHDRSNLRRPQM
jgi:hypothetical protein